MFVLACARANPLDPVLSPLKLPHETVCVCGGWEENGACFCIQANLALV